MHNKVNNSLKKVLEFEVRLLGILKMHYSLIQNLVSASLSKLVQYISINF